MRASLSQVENIYDLSSALNEEKSVRDVHRRPQKVFDLSDAHALKVN